MAIFAMGAGELVAGQGRRGLGYRSGMSAAQLWPISIAADLATECGDDHSPNRSGLKWRKLHHRVVHGCLAATLCQIHPKICYSLVESVPGNQQSPLSAFAPVDVVAEF